MYLPDQFLYFEKNLVMALKIIKDEEQLAELGIESLIVGVYF